MGSNRICSWMLLLWFLAIYAVEWPSTAFAQTVVIINDTPTPLPRPIFLPRPPNVSPPLISYYIKELAIQARVRNQIADVQVTQSFVNNSSSTIQAQFVFPLPYDGAIDKLTLMVDGKELPAQLLTKEEARARYEAIVRANQDPALLEWIGQGMFQTSVFPIPPGAERKVVLHYDQLLRKDKNLTDFLFPLSTARYTSAPLEKISMDVSIESPTPLKNVYSPSHQIDVQRTGAKSALVKWSAMNIVPTSDFRLFFDDEPGTVSGSLISYRPTESEDGYFLFLASPEIKAKEAERPRKTVIFVVDKSGSMVGKKIEQAKGAIKYVLNNLRENDLFNIVAYESKVESFRPELETYNEKTRQEALAYVDGLHAGGGTNIHDSLKTALSGLQDPKCPTYVIFSTDGLPTVGTTNEAKIGQIAKESNKVRARVLPFGVGYDVNSRLLDRLAREHFGYSAYVRPEEDIEASVSRVFTKISSPVFSQGKLTLEVDTVDGNRTANRIYPSGEIDLFEGEQLVAVGRYSKPGAGKITLTGSVGNEDKSFDFSAELTSKSKDHSYSFVEKLWATRRIGELIDELDLNGKNSELTQELVMLSTKHGILTPYTSFLADETVRPELASTANLQNTSQQLEKLSVLSGRDGVNQRSAKQSFKTADRASGSLPSGIGGEGMDDGPAVAVGLSAARSRDSNVTDRIQQTDSSTLYRRGNVVVTPETASLDIEKDKDKITKIKRFSSEYFDLIRANSAADNQLLSQQSANEQLLVQLRGINYLIE